MAHEIETYTDADGREYAAALFARTDAWHKLGTTLTHVDGFTAEDAMELAHLGGWNVRKSQAQTTLLSDEGVSTVDIPGCFATVRTNPFTGQPDVLGYVGQHYTPIQNEQHAAFLNALVDESGAVFDTAGSLANGKRVFITMKMPRTMLIGGVDEVTINIAALNSHDGTSSFQLLTTPVRVVCANTERAALGNNRGLFKIRHTTNATRAVEEARQALDLSFAYCDAFEQEAEKMIQTTCTDAQFWEMAASLFGKPDEDDASKRALTEWNKRAETLAMLWHDASTQKVVSGTRWAAYNVVTEYADHFHAVNAPEGHDLTARAERVVAGAYDALKQTAFELCSV